MFRAAGCLLAVGVLAGPPAPAFDHSAFGALLRAHVRDGMVDYDAFARAPTFRAYLASLDQADPLRLDDAERLAYWINVYNAYTIELINRHGERNSIRNINKTLRLSLKGPWKEKLVRAGAASTTSTRSSTRSSALSGRSHGSTSRSCAPP